MNNPGLGTDILEIRRLQEALKRTPKMQERLFSEKELKYCLSYGPAAIVHLAGRFAAKEAVAKALGVGFGKELSFLDLEILNDEKGRPVVFLSPRAQKKFTRKISLSISHSKTMALAFALAF
ncbi:MAG: holo-ACP synthase [Parachlamydiales bacterium]|jgi:holo-[acyl-carrier protein] synthase